MEQLNKNARVKAGEFLGGNLDFYTFRTLLDISQDDYLSVSQERLNRLIQIISMRCQPIIINIDVSEEVDPSDFPTVSGKVKVYTMKFAFEHERAWDTSPSLQDELVGVVGFTKDNTSIYYHESL